MKYTQLLHGIYIFKNKIAVLSWCLKITAKKFDIHSLTTMHNQSWAQSHAISLST